MTGFTDNDDEKDNFYDFEEDFYQDRISLIKHKGKNINNKYKKDGVRPCLFPTTLNKIDEVDESRVKSPEDEGKNNKNLKNDNESLLKDENGNLDADTKKFMWKSEDEVIHIHNKRERPKSANSESTFPLEFNLKKRPNSSYSSYEKSKIPVSTSPQPKSVLKKNKSDSESTSSSSSIVLKRRPSSAGSKPAYRDYSSWENINSDDLDSLIGYEENSYPVRPTSACGIRTPNFGSNEYLNKKGDWILCLG